MYHFLVNMTDLKNTIDLNGPIQVSTFFLLSGYGLALKYGPSDEVTNKAGKTWRFLLKRFIRIAPLYYLANIMELIIYFTPGVAMMGAPLSWESVVRTFSFSITWSMSEMISRSRWVKWAPTIRSAQGAPAPH